MSVLYGILALCLFAGISANLRVRRDDILPNAPAFNQTEFLGRWYEYANYAVKYIKNMHCRMFDWTSITTDHFLVSTSYISYNGEKDELGKEDYVARALDLSKPQRFSMDVIENLQWQELHYWILNTDHISYAIVYSWEDDLAMGWILTRERNPPRSVADKALKRAEELGYDRHWKQHNQSGCDLQDIQKINEMHPQKSLSLDLEIMVEV